MKFDPWTFIFQIVNFVVLLLILKRILYKPIREIMEKRRALAAGAMEEAQNALKEAQALKTRREEELEAFRSRHAELGEEMKNEVAQERRKLLAEAAEAAKRQADKERALFETEKIRQGTQLRELAVGTVERYAANLFRDIADEDLHQALYRRLLGETDRVAAGLRDAAVRNKVLSVEVTSAYPLREDEERRLHEALETRAGSRVVLSTTVDKELIAGARIRAADTVYDASLRGQLNTLAAGLKEST